MEVAMDALRMIWALAPVDARGVWRDPLLRWLLLVPLGLGLATRSVFPNLLEQVATLLPFGLASVYQPLMAACLLLIGPLLAGMVVGFLLLDQRDEGTLVALQVTPLPAWAYLLYRLGLPLLSSIPLSVLAFGLSEIHVPGWRLTGALLLAAPLGPLYALALAKLAQNKVQGFALAKAAGVFIAAPLATLFTSPLWDHILLFAPTTWAARYLWQGEWWVLVGGIVYQAGLIGWLWQVRG
jgi:fluoroquinolone transport system permease protein